jgi:hypothetical protein
LPGRKSDDLIQIRIVRIVSMGSIIVRRAQALSERGGCCV